MGETGLGEGSRVSWERTSVGDRESWGTAEWIGMER